MALSLSCSCGAAFEVEDTFAGQAVSCPDCGAAVKAPPLRPPAVRTSGYALASVVLALVGAFTLVGTVAAVLLGAVALASIRRHRDRVTGTGFALFGILAGAVFTALTGFAAVNGELFEQYREQIAGSQVERGGPLEVVRERDGFAITRPSRAWGVATPEFARSMNCEGELVLVNVAKDAYLAVSRRDAGGLTLDELRDSFLDDYGRSDPAAVRPNDLDNLGRFTHFKLRESRRLPPQGGAEVVEVLFDARTAGQNLAFRARLLKPHDGSRVYAQVAWAFRRRLPDVEDDVRKAMDSFRLLAGPR
jgi:hypothetical protein